VIAVRRAGVADATAVLDCLHEAFEPYRSQYTPGAFEDTTLNDATIASRIADLVVFVAVDDGGAIVGTIGWLRIDDAEAHVRGMAVRPVAQGTGVALQLLEALEADVRAAGCSRMSLDTTLPLVRATRFYLRHGFVATGRVSDFFGMPMHEYLKPLSSRVRGRGAGMLDPRAARP